MLDEDGRLDVARPAALPGEHTEEALRDWGFETAEIEALGAAGAIAQRRATDAPAWTA
ncbi:MAG: hypothetical protein JSS68_07895 [Actinobacteria bacterium]|nr:hypothetical protein [Actinomycetota bacterium]